MPTIAPQRERISEIQIMFPTFADLPIASERGDVVNGLMHVATYTHKGTVTDTIGRIFPKVLKATKNRWEGTEFVPWFNDPNIKLTHDGLKLITEVGGLHDLRKGDAIRLVGSGYKEEGKDVEFYHTEGKTVATYLYDGESFRTTQRRLVVDYAITLEDEPEEAPEPAEEAPAGADGQGEPEGAVEGEADVEVGDHILVPAELSPTGLPIEGLIVSVDQKKGLALIQEIGTERKYSVSILGKTPEGATVPPPPGVPPPKPTEGLPSEEEGTDAYLPAEFAEVKVGSKVIVTREGKESIIGTVIEKDSEGMFVKSKVDGKAIP